MAETANFEVATLGGGCFWCLEAVFEQLRGVERVESGYSGGSVPEPTYKEVCTGSTGHAEVIQVTFDPKSISFGEILDVFFGTHDPSTPNREAPTSARSTDRLSSITRPSRSRSRSRRLSN